jgi:glyoxylase-like metal-dependent hydrolase (beta-lactamase superfamily II)
VAELRHSPAVHTDGDTYVYFPDADVLATGDIVFLGRYPNIDFAYGGSIDGMIRGVDELIGFAKETTTVIPGHGPVGTKANMREYREMLVVARDRIARLKAAGKSEDEVVAAKPNADFDARFGSDARGNANFIRVVYRSLKS